MEQAAKSFNHGDLRLKNILLDSEGRIAAILDWEKCLSQVAPYWELSIALHDLSIDDKEAFLEGYGLNPANYALSAPAVRFFNILNYSTEVSQAAEQGDHPALERLSRSVLVVAAGIRQLAGLECWLTVGRQSLRCTNL